MVLNESASIQMDDKEKELEKIREEVSVCQKCKLGKTRVNAVPGEGDPNAEIIFIGEAPGANEDKKGIPFCGAAGNFLDEMLGSIGLDRKDIFITNTVKCRPPENRDPEDDEKTACRPFLEQQFKIINPKLIVCLGRHSAATFLPGAGTITTTHGKAFRRPSGQVYLPLYHPAAALHNGSLRQTLVADFNKIPEILKKINQSNNEKDPPTGGKKADNINQLKLI